MPQGNDYFGGTTDALRMMIPLVINRRNIEANALEQQKRLDWLKQQSDAQLERDILKQQADEKKAQSKVQTDLLVNRLKAAEEAGDTSTFQALAPLVEQATGAKLPGYFSSPEGRDLYHMIPPKPDKLGKEALPNTLEAYLARSVKTPEEALKLKERLIRYQQQQEQAFRPQTADEKLPPNVALALNIARLYKETGKVDLTSALIANMPGVAPEVKEALTSTRKTPEEVTQLVDWAYKTLNSQTSKYGGGSPAPATVGDDPDNIRKLLMK